MRRFCVPNVLYGDDRCSKTRLVTSLVTSVAVMMLGFLASAGPASAADQAPTVKLSQKLCADKGAHNGSVRLKVANPNDTDETYHYVVKAPNRTYKGSVAVDANSTVTTPFKKLTAGKVTAKVHGNGTSADPVTTKVKTCPRVVVRHGTPDWGSHTVQVTLYDPSNRDVTFTVKSNSYKTFDADVSARHSLGAEMPLLRHDTTRIRVYSSGHLRAKWHFSPN